MATIVETAQQLPRVSPTPSIEHDEEELKKTEKVKSRKPPNSAFRQQRLKAWQPILTPKTVLPLLFLTGVIFAPIGGLLLYASAQVQELVLDYTDCSTLAPTDTAVPMPTERVTAQYSSPKTVSQPTWLRSTEMRNYSKDPQATPVSISTCTISFQIPADIHPPIFLYYRLTKFYQNHRRYVKSLNQDQINGKATSFKDVQGSDCAPLDVADGKIVYPCGLIANSQFNDTFYSPVQLNPSGGDSGNNRTIHMTNKGIAWSSDKQIFGVTAYTPDQVVPPPNWRMRYPFGYTQYDPIPNIQDDEELQVWMRTAGLPTFSKLALKNTNETMEEGNYQIVIDDTFPVSEYGGTKSILISTRTVMGGKNPFLGIAYVIVAGICIVLGTVFLATHLIKPRKLGDHTYLTWNSDQPTSSNAIARAARPGDA